MKKSWRENGINLENAAEKLQDLNFPTLPKAEIAVKRFIAMGLRSSNAGPGSPTRRCATPTGMQAGAHDI